MYYEILDLIITQIEVRFSDMENLKFFGLLDTTEFTTFEKKFPVELLTTLFNKYPNYFRKDKLENELRVIYSDADILGTSVDLVDKLRFIFTNCLQTEIS